jgi:bifunctional non-homologous end joining protein LigD
MSIKKYKEKRNFKKTSEPKGKTKKVKEDLIFVVQKHDATNLHYDFRLELDGVLKSWAVPKGPSLDPKEKRLAMMVEDHPFDYKDFEGVIPKGNYGAGEVIVWDKGTYHSIETDDRKESIPLLKKGLEKGDLKITLHGEKLNGQFALVNMKKPKQNAWLLIKKKDDYATDKDILKDDRSVVSGKGINEIGKDEVKKKSRQINLF